MSALTPFLVCTFADLVIACMRVRKLGKGQTVVFCVSEEIKNKIIECGNDPSTGKVEISDILRWTIKETWTDIDRSVFHWETQGVRFAKHSALRKEYTKDGKLGLTEQRAREFLEDEAKSLHDRYHPKVHAVDEATTTPNAKHNLDLIRISERCREFGGLQVNSSVLEEEQERELSPEIEQERQVQRAPTAQPLPHNLHADVRRFVTGGVPVFGSKAYLPAFQALGDVSAADQFDVSQFCCSSIYPLLVTADFTSTVVKDPVSHRADSFQRPVQWILTSTPTDDTVKHMMIISPYEAEKLLPLVRTSKVVALHLYTPRWNLGYDTLDRLDLFTIPARTTPLVIPSSLRVQLNLFAGQLYLNSYDDYLDVCSFLGLAAEAAKEGWVIASDGFVLQDGYGRVGAGSGLRVRPIKFLRALMTDIRRDGESIDKTHLGTVLDGGLLQREDFGA